ncbi:MAG TPA: hypothetical protein VOA64_02950 [Candidatus Dormibacteraeota bacterium]|nr:hypothetical protein [Candidatus Dormibacteraeota bacterium]
MNRETPRWIIVARILRPRGNKGEVAAEILTDFPERLTKLTEVFVGRAESSATEGGTETVPRRIGVQCCWLSQNHRGQAVFHFAGVTSINEAERFRGLDVLLPFEQRVTLPAGQHFAADLIGCSIFEHPSSPSASSSPCSLSEAPGFLGIVRDVQFIGDNISGTPLLEVETSQGELLIPLADDICTRIDTTAHRIDVKLPDGLRTLNRE